jgi:hypothetical protein
MFASLSTFGKVATTLTSLGALGGGTISCVAAYDNTPSRRIARMVKVFEEGCDVQQFQNEDAKSNVARPELHRQLRDFLRPEQSKFYGVFFGVNGSGKSTAIRQVIAKLDKPRGVLYCSVPGHCDVTGVLIPLLRYHGWYDKFAFVGAWREKEPTWRDLAAVLDSAASVFMAKHHMPAVLVLDSIDYLAKRREDILQDLQLWAKDGADTGNMRVIFVGSEGNALSQLSANSAFSRAQEFQSLNLDISDDDAVRYVMDRTNKTEAEAKNIVRDVTGGRFVHLNGVRNDQTFEELRSLKWQNTQSIIGQMGLSPKDKLFKELVTPTGSRIMLKSDAVQMLPRDKIAELVRRNILTEKTTEKLAIHSRYIEAFLRAHQK